MTAANTRFRSCRSASIRLPSSRRGVKKTERTGIELRETRRAVLGPALSHHFSVGGHAANRGLLRTPVNATKDMEDLLQMTRLSPSPPCRTSTPGIALE